MKLSQLKEEVRNILRERSVKAIQKDYSNVIADMEKHLELYKKSKGTPEEKKHIGHLKTLTQKKKSLQKELDLAVAGLYKNAELKVDESVNEDIEPQTKKIASLTGTRADAVKQFVSANALNITKLLKFIEKGKLSDRMDFVSAIAGKPNNPIQKKIIKMFSEAVNESPDTNSLKKIHDAVLKFLKTKKGVGEVKEFPEFPNRYGDNVSTFSVKYNIEDKYNYDLQEIKIEYSTSRVFIPNKGYFPFKTFNDIKNIINKKSSLKESVNEGKKVFKVNPQIGKAKYSISSHDGVKKHKDGSDFFDIEIFKNKVDLEKAIKNYTSKGFVKESVNEAKTYKKGDKLKIKLKNGKKFDVVFVDYSRTKGIAYGKFKDGGEVETKPFSLDFIVESVINEDTRRVKLLGIDFKVSEMNGRIFFSFVDKKAASVSLRQVGTNKIVNHIQKRLDIAYGKGTFFFKSGDHAEFQNGYLFQRNTPEINLNKLKFESVNESTEPQIISQLKDIVKNKQYQSVKDPKTGKSLRVDMQTANAVLQIYNGLSNVNKDNMVKMGLPKMIDVSFKIINKYKK